MDIEYWVVGEGPNGVTFCALLPYLGEYEYTVTNGMSAAMRRSNVDVLEQKVLDLLKVYNENVDYVRLYRRK